MSATAEEASKLFDAVQEWARRASAGTADHLATGAPECQLCPVCQLIAALRGSRPELVEHLGAAATSLFAALRVAVDAHEREWSARRSAGIEHIDVD